MGKCGKFLLGGIVGAALGILFAPKSGAETRACIKEKAQAYLDNADVMTDNARDKAVELYSTASDYAGDAGVQLKEKITTARGKITDTAGTAKGKITDKVASVKAAKAGADTGAAQAPPFDESLTS